MGNIYLIRHGAAGFGTDNYDQLAKRGQQQATLLGQELAAQGVQPTRVLGGTMQRHRQTAKAVQETLGTSLALNTDAAWNEYDHEEVIHRYDSALQDRANMLQLLANSDNPRRAFHQMFTAAVERWTSGDHHDYTESWQSFRARVNSAVLALPGQLDKGETVLVFSSGGTIATAVGSLLGLDTPATIDLHWSIANASITRLRYSKNRVSVLSVNELGYLRRAQPELLSYR